MANSMTTTTEQAPTKAEVFHKAYASYIDGKIGTEQFFNIAWDAALAATQSAPMEDIPLLKAKAFAFDEWIEKTNWVQEQMGTFPIKALGMHRADVMKEEIERLRAAQSAQNSQVDWLGLALDLEQQAKRVESQTVERSMLAAAHGLRLMGAAQSAQPQELIGEVRENGVHWFGQNPYAHPIGTKFYAAQAAQQAREPTKLASINVHHVGEPQPFPMDAAMSLIKSGLKNVRSATQQPKGELTDEQILATADKLSPLIRRMIGDGLLIDFVRALLSAQPTAQDSLLLDAIAENYWKLDPFDRPTGGDDCDVGWRILQYHMDKPHERTVAKVFKDDPREAIRAAIAQGEKK